MTRSVRASGTSRTLPRAATAAAPLSAVSVLACAIAPAAVADEGSAVPLTRETDGSLTGELRTSLRAGATLEPGGTAGAAFTLAAAQGAPTGRLDVTTELTVTVAGTDGPVRTGVSATDHSRITADGTGPRPSPSPSHPHRPKPTPPGGGHGNGHGHWGGGHGGASLPSGPVDAGDGSTALTGSGSDGLSGPGLAIGAAGLLAAVAASVCGLRAARRRRG